MEAAATICGTAKRIIKNLAAIVLVVLLLQQLFAGVAYSQSGTYRGRARLFVADNSPLNPSIAVVDLPAYTVTQRIQLPGTSLQLGVSQDNSHVGVFRNRDNQQQFFSIINTGIVPVLSAAGTRAPSPAPLKDGENGTMRAAFVAKSVIFVNGTDNMAGVDIRGRSLMYHDIWQLYLAQAEFYGRIYTYTADALNSVSAFKPTSTFSLPPGRFQIVPYGNFTLVSHASMNKAYIYDRSGRVVREYPCTACNGVATYLQAAGQGTMTAVFSANNSVLVVRNTSATGTSIPAFPSVGSFVGGAPGVFWSSFSAQSRFWRTDVRDIVPRITSNVTHRGGLLRMLSLSTHDRFICVHSDGNLVLYDGDSGAPLGSILLRAAGFPTNQTAPNLQSDTLDEHVFISVPATGLVYVVHVEHGGHEEHGHAAGEEPEDEPAPVTLSLERTVAVGGVPTSMTLAYMPGVLSFASD
ncbi:hypothetical protein Vretimale_11434 [Volvox reticuliferus]|uniref:Uncharacterized protein n=1 Tax=Volvox reticuliferus TaxID=1737510 RepID=A0A8J4FRN1_9CHLO|nr:hypothetical protein Vretifemale_11987 [Volvox reticuliferus]GIM07236.1 hypothetical protein Vretimale_11434 [Volvox reticuliferus]